MEAAKKKTQARPSRESGRSTGLQPGRTRLNNVAPLLPYQAAWIEDKSPLKIVVKGRQEGFSFATALEAVLGSLAKKSVWVLLSKGERQSRLLMEKVQDHIRAIGVAADYHESDLMEGTVTKQLEARFPNGSVIYALPANPDTARGYTGHVRLDEFAFHQDAERIYTALYPTITRGFTIGVISTPNGQRGKFFEIAKEAGLTGDSPSTALRAKSTRSSGWSGHKTSILDAVAQGLKVDIEALRAGVDEETWRQEYLCEFISSASEWITAELFQQCVSSEASATLDALRRAQGEKQEALFAGWDIARNRDLSVIWLAEMVGDVTWTRGVIEMRNMSTPDQVREAQALMPLVRRMAIDQSGMGLAIAEQMEEAFPGKVEGVQFTAPAKEAMAVLAKRRMEETKARLPDDDKIRASFRSVKKTLNAVGQARFDAEHDAKYGHADHWWAFCLAETAAEQPTYHLADCADVIGRPICDRAFSAAEL